MASDKKAGRLVFFQDVAVVESGILEHVKQPEVRAALLLGCILVDSLKSIAVSLNRPSVPTSPILGVGPTSEVRPTEVF
jgi:hypothetical protein